MGAGRPSAIGAWPLGGYSGPGLVSSGLRPGPAVAAPCRRWPLAVAWSLPLLGGPAAATLRGFFEKQGNQAVAIRIHTRQGAGAELRRGSARRASRRWRALCP